jgi:exopolyphosphatase/guanosine-5'-triphosphate,3'-diphosphate pyrophosphatase
MKNNSLTLEVPSSWAQIYPQSMHLLQQEVDAWQKSPWLFQLKAQI